MSRYHAHGGGATRPGEMSSASERREVQERGDRLPRVRRGGGHARTRQGMGAHLHRVLHAGMSLYI